MMKKIFALLSLVLPLAACTSVTPDPFLTASVPPSAAALATEVSPEYATALLPAIGGRIQAVRQTVSDVYLRQQVLYETSPGVGGENSVTVELVTAFDNGKFMRAPSRSEILAEMRKTLPGIPMRVRPEIGENAQGTFGYATARHGTTGACLYGWQLANPDSKLDAISLVTRSNRSYRMQIRVRYCSLQMNEDTIAVLMRGLRAKPVNRDTLAMLKFAEGSAQLAVPAPSVLPTEIEKPVQAVAPRRRVVKEEVGDVEDVVLPIMRRTPMTTATAPVPVQAAASPVAGAARIPLPAVQMVQQPLLQAAAIPLPGAVAN